MGPATSTGAMLPESDGNRAIFVRFQEEGLDAAEFYDSDVSDGELDDAIGDLREVNALAAQPKEDRRQTALPIHTIFVLDSSASMGMKDVDGKQRLSAVFDACDSFITQNAGQADTQDGDCYTLISFDAYSQVWFTRLGASEAREALQDVRYGLWPAVHATRFRAAFQKITEVISAAPKKHREDARVILLSDGAPHEGRGFGDIRCKACAMGDVEGGDTCKVCKARYRSEETKEVTAASLMARMEEDLLGSPALCGIKQLVINTVAFGANAEEFERFLRPLSERTGGTHHVSSLSQLDLMRTFGTLVSSITTTRTSMVSSSQKPTGDLNGQRFDSAETGTSCERICTVSRVGQQGKRARLEDSYEVKVKAKTSLVTIESKPFAFGGMRLVYNMRDSFNKDDSGARMRMVAKRLMQKQHASQDDMLAFCRSTEVAIRFRTSFLRAIKENRRSTMFFVPCYLYSYDGPRGQKCCFVAEQYLEGDFVKFNSNNGYVLEDHPQSELLQAFSHYTFVQSKGTTLVVDLQGVVDNGCLMLTDPQVVSRAKRKKIFGPGDIGFEGMLAFFETHKCGPTCAKLRLLEKQQKFQEEMEIKQKTCVICLAAPRVTVFKPCRHSLACESCAAELLGRNSGCPLCRERIEGYDSGVFQATYAPQGEARAPGRRLRETGQKEPSGPVRIRVERQEPRNVEVQSLLLPAAAPVPAAVPVPPTPARRQRRPALNTRASRGGGGTYKTILCEYWERDMCNRGRDCTFAHGLREIRR